MGINKITISNFDGNYNNFNRNELKNKFKNEIIKPYVDIPMTLFLVYLLLYGITNNMITYQFFAIRDLVYHGIEYIIYKNL